MCRLVQIDDHIQQVQISLTFTEEDRRFVADVWDRADPLLARLQGMAVFQGKLTLADLDLTRFRLLIAMHLTLLAGIPERHTTNRGHPIVKSLHLLLLGLLRALESRLGGQIPFLSLTRLSQTDVAYTFQARLDPITFPSFTTPPAFRIVIDNS
jgi:hypothetical protein